MTSLAKSSDIAVVKDLIKMAILENGLTITKIKLWLFEVSSCKMKSIEIDVHGLVATGRGLSKPYFLCRKDLF